MTTATKELQGFTDRQEFKSSVIHEAFYDADTQRLFLILHTGSTPAYKNVDDGTWQSLKYSASAGQFWNRHIRHLYPGVNGDVDLFRRDPAQDVEPEPEVNYTVENVDLRDTFNPTPTISRRYVVTVEFDATSVADALGKFSGEGFEITGVNVKGSR